jgi:hypothetical protein
VKKTVTILLALLYLVSFTGVTMHQHFCMGEQAGWDLGKDVPEICSRCGMKKTDKISDGCCSDEYKFIKNTIDQKGTENSLQLQQTVHLTLPTSFEILTHQLLFISGKNPISHAPLRSCSQAVYIRNCVFLI